MSAVVSDHLNGMIIAKSVKLSQPEINEYFNCCNDERTFRPGEV